MSKIVLDDIASGYQLSKVNANFQKIEDELNNKVLYKAPPLGEPNALQADLDVGGFTIYNAGDFLVDGVSVVTAGEQTITARDAALASASAALVSENNAEASELAAASSAASALLSKDSATSSAASAASNASAASSSSSTASSAAITASNAAGLAAGLLAPVTATSTSSVAIGTGSKSFTIETGKSLVAGHPIRIVRTSDPVASNMTGSVVSYNSLTGALVTDITSVTGSGTFTDWTLSVSASSVSTAAATTFIPTGNIAATNVQTAIAELDTEKAATSHTHSGTYQPASANLDEYAAVNPTAAGLALLDDADAPAQRTTLGLVIGTNVQAYDAQLFSNIPQNSKSAAYTLVLTDGQKHIFHPNSDTTARTFTIPDNSSVAFPIGTAITFINENSAGAITIAITTDTLRLAGTGLTGSRTLAANGIATAIKVTSTKWYISGTGLT